MKKQSRVKSIVRWTAWVLALLLPAMWVFTWWGNAVLNVPIGSGQTHVVVALTYGAMYLGVDNSGSLRATFWELRGYPVFPADWWPRYDHLPGTTVVVLPLWMPSIVAIAFSVWFYRDHRREERERRLGCCPACGYDRSGLASTAPCPECGRPNPTP